MYEEFRLNMLRELANADLEGATLQRVMQIVDKLGGEYDVSRKEMSLVPREMTSQWVLMEYLASRSLEGLSKETLYGYRMLLIQFLSRLRKNLDEVDSNDIRLFLYQYQQQRKVSNRTLDHIRTTICCFFRWCAAEGKIPRDPSLTIKPIKHKNALTQLELEYIRRQAAGLREHAIIEMFYSTGCRVSELCNMMKSDINWDDCSVTIFGKGSKYRTSWINAKAYVALKDYLASRTDNDPHVFVSERQPHQGLTRFAVEHIVSEISDRAFYLTGRHVTPHIFRHTTVTTAIRAGMPIQNVSKMVGHEQVETTMIYADIDMTDVKHEHMKYVV